MNEIRRTAPSPGGYSRGIRRLRFARTFFAADKPVAGAEWVDASNRAMLEVFCGACMQA